MKCPCLFAVGYDIMTPISPVGVYLRGERISAAGTRRKHKSMNDRGELL